MAALRTNYLQVSAAGSFGTARAIASPMRATILHYKGFGFFFSPNAASRKAVHVYCGDGEATFWLEPTIELAENSGLQPRQLREAQGIIEERKDEIVEA